MNTATFRVYSKDETVSEVVTISFESKDMQLLEAYLKNCDRLADSHFLKEGYPQIGKISITQTEGLKVDVPEIDYRDVCEFLHLGRPIFLQSEPASFRKAMTTVGSAAKGTLLTKVLKQISKVYNEGHYKKYFTLSVGSIELFNDKSLNAWLNGVEYHQDAEKKKVIEELKLTLSEEEIRGVFLSQLAGKVDGTFRLAEFISRASKSMTNKGFNRAPESSEPAKPGESSDGAG